MMDIVTTKIKSREPFPAVRAVGPEDGKFGRRTESRIDLVSSHDGGTSMITSEETTRIVELAAAPLRELFAMPVLQYLWPDSAILNRQLRDLILRKREASPGVVKTNRGGWQSKADLQNWPEDCVQILLRRVQSMIQEMVRRTVPDPDERHLENWRICAWANVNTTGSFNTPHHHDGPNSLWSGFYYVDVGQLSPDGSISGRTLFQDRSGVAKEIIRNPNLFEREAAISPLPRMMVLFPARLWHYVAILRRRSQDNNRLQSVASRAPCPILPGDAATQLVVG